MPNEHLKRFSGKLEELREASPLKQGGIAKDALVELNRVLYDFEQRLQQMEKNLCLK